MRILHLSTFDTAGGAARSAYRLHEGLGRVGVTSKMFVLRASAGRPDIVSFRPPAGLRSRLMRAIRRELRKRQMQPYRKTRSRGVDRFSTDRADYLFREMADQLPGHDILHLHWTTGLVDCPSFFASLNPGVPVVWTLHDMNPFTGGCHFAGSCSRYSERCGRCIQLGSNHDQDLSRAVWSRKHRLFFSLRDNFHFVAPSQWMAVQARLSSLLRGRPITVIPYGIDVDIFQPRPKQPARQAIGLPEKARVLLFVSNYLGTARKGLYLLDEALSELDVKDTLLLTIGHGAVGLKSSMRHIRLNHVTDDRLLAVVYSAADLLVLPSLEDNLPNTMMEALACGIPTVAFAVGGMPELIQPGSNGLLIPPGDVAALTRGIQSLLADDFQLEDLSRRCRQRAIAEYSLERQAGEYRKLYQSLLNDRN